MKNLIILFLLSMLSTIAYGQSKLVGKWKIIEIKNAILFPSKDPNSEAKSYAEKNIHAEITFHEDMKISYKLKDDPTIYRGTWAIRDEVNYHIRSEHKTYTYLDVKIKGLSDCAFSEEFGSFKKKRKYYTIHIKGNKVTFERISDDK